LTSKETHLIWYILGGFLLILTGIFLYLDISIDYLPPLTLVLGGVLLTLSFLSKKPPRGRALTVFLLGLIVFALTGFFTIHPSTQTVEVYTLTREQISVDRLAIILKSTTGNIHLAFTEDKRLIYNITITKTLPFPPRRVEFLNYTRDGWLVVEVDAETSGITILLAPDMIYNLTLTTTTGNIEVEGGLKALIEELEARVTTGNIHVTLGRGVLFQSLETSSTVGNIYLTLHAEELRGESMVSAQATTGDIELNLEVGRGIDCVVSAKTDLGRITPHSKGFTPLVEEYNEYRVQRKGYGGGGILKVYLETDIGNIYMELKG